MSPPKQCAPPSPLVLAVQPLWLQESVLCLWGSYVCMLCKQFMPPAHEADPTCCMRSNRGVRVSQSFWNVKTQACSCSAEKNININAVYLSPTAQSVLLPFMVFLRTTLQKWSRLLVLCLMTQFSSVSHAHQMPLHCNWLPRITEVGMFRRQPVLA